MSEGFEYGAARLNEPTLRGVGRCPHCSIATPLLTRIQTGTFEMTASDGVKTKWCAYACSYCGGWITAKAAENDSLGNPLAVQIFPRPRVAHDDLPPVVRRFLQQAFDTSHAPDAAAVMAGSAVDAMLKELGLRDGSLYSRIDQALQKNMLTQAMADWAHEVRLGSNRPRHADADRPHVTEAEARQSVEFADALGNFLFVLTARIERGRAEAAKAEAEAATKS